MAIIIIIRIIIISGSIAIIVTIPAVPITSAISLFIRSRVLTLDTVHKIVPGLYHAEWTIQKIHCRGIVGKNCSLTGSQVQREDLIRVVGGDEQCRTIGKKEKAPARPIDPAARPLNVAPMDCAASV